VLKDFLDSCPAVDRDNELVVANMRKGLEEMSSSKLMYLQLSSQFDSPPSDEELMKHIKAMRLTHNGCRNWDLDRRFQFYRQWLRRGVIEMSLELRAIEVVYQAISRRDETGKPVIDTAARDMSLAVLNHTGWSKAPDKQPPQVNVNNLIMQPGQTDEDKRKVYEDLTRIARENEEQAAIIEALKKRKNPSSALAVVTTDDEKVLKEVESRDG